MRLFDLHSHTARCGHASGKVKEYVERALALGISDFGISDHSPWMFQNSEIPMAMRWHELPGYIEEVRRMQECYNCESENSFHVHLGMEMDFIPSRLEIARETVKQYEWDYLLGSIHNIGLWAISDPAEAPRFRQYFADDVMEFYFDLVRQMVRARFCDIIAHLDLPKKYGFTYEGSYLRWIEPLIPEIREAGIAVEINTSGLEAPCKEVFPDWTIIEALAAGGVMLTLGSDSHAPDQVGRHFPQVIEKLRRIGVKELVRFEKRQPIAVSIEADEDAGVMAG